jgi:ABC-2 type transport system permease protein
METASLGCSEVAETPVSERMAPGPAHERHRPSYFLRVLGVTAGAEFRLKYSGSALGYFWSVAKPLAFFTMLYLVFGHVFKLNALSPYYPVSLLIGIVMYTFVSDATNLAMYSLVTRQSLLRKLVFPRMVIPTSAVLTAGITFVVNLVVVSVFIAAKGITPRLSWLLVVPLLLELFAVVLAVSLILAAIFVRLRDVGQVWDLVLQLFFYASPIVYPIGYLPNWARQLAFLNPFTQILQQVRAIILYPDLPTNKITAQQALGSWGGLVPIAIVLVLGVLAVAFFRRQEPWFAERV